MLNVLTYCMSSVLCTTRAIHNGPKPLFKVEFEFSSIHKTCLIFLKSIFVSSVLSPFPPLGHKRAEIEFSGGAVVASEIDLGSCLTISACHPDNKQMIKAMWQELLLTNMTKGRNTNADGFLPACTSDRFEVVTHNLELSSQQ